MRSPAPPAAWPARTSCTQPAAPRMSICRSRSRPSRRRTHLPQLANELSAGAWWSLAETLHRLATDAQHLRVDARHDPESILRQQLLAGELPLALGYLFPELQPMRSLRHSARQALSEGLIAVTDGEGLPHARLLTVLAPLWACWTRCERIGQQLHHGPWSRNAQNQYLWLVRRMIRMVDGDVRLPFVDGQSDDEPSLKPILATAAFSWWATGAMPRLPQSPFRRILSRAN